MRSSGHFCLLPLALLLAALAPTIARAETVTFLKAENLVPSVGGGLEGPANHFPSTIDVAGLSGTVTKATVTLIGYDSGSPDDTDMVITGPNGQQVMLMSDACGLNPSEVDNGNWTFDDSALTFLSNPGPCPSSQEASFKPSNYLGDTPDPGDDELGPGGPTPPYANAMSFFNGASPNGAWNLFVFDDNSAFVGFTIPGWALTLEIQPPAPPPGGAPPGDTSPPDTTITERPKDKTKKKTATFEFSASEPATFECALDGKQQFKPCTSPFTVKVKKGKHTFTVLATDASGNADPTPASDGWKVKKK
jgi:hypothetical protein